MPGFPPGDAWKVFVPGLLVQLGIFGGVSVGFTIINEWRSGVIDRQMVSPASRTALILGRVLRDVVVLLIQGTILIGAAALFGLRIPFYAIVLGLLLTVLLGASFSALSYAVGLALKSEDAFAPLINSFALPILLLSRHPVADEPGAALAAIPLGSQPVQAHGHGLARRLPWRGLHRLRRARLRAGRDAADSVGLGSARGVFERQTK